MLFLTLQTSLHYCSLYLKFTVKFCRANVGNKWKTWSVLHSDIFQSKLSQRFKVQGIPTLIMVNCEDGSIITRDGRQCVVDDPEGKEFPWRPKPLGEIVEGVLINSKGEETKWGDLASKIVGFYFSAHWVSDKFSYQNSWLHICAQPPTSDCAPQPLLFYPQFWGSALCTDSRSPCHQNVVSPNVHSNGSTELQNWFTTTGSQGSRDCCSLPGLGHYSTCQANCDRAVKKKLILLLLRFFLFCIPLVSTLQGIHSWAGENL